MLVPTIMTTSQMLCCGSQRKALSLETIQHLHARSTVTGKPYHLGRPFLVSRRYSGKAEQQQAANTDNRYASLHSAGQAQRLRIESSLLSAHLGQHDLMKLTFAHPAVSGVFSPRFSPACFPGVPERYKIKFEIYCGS